MVGTNEPTFPKFRDGLGGKICNRLGLDISACQSWRGYTHAMVRFNDMSDGSLVAAAKRLHGVISSSERAVLHAALAAGDFAAQADEMSEGSTWVRLDKLGDTARESVAAAVLRRD